MASDIYYLVKADVPAEVSGNYPRTMVYPDVELSESVFKKRAWLSSFLNHATMPQPNGERNVASIAYFTDFKPLKDNPRLLYYYWTDPNWCHFNFRHPNDPDVAVPANVVFMYNQWPRAWYFSHGFVTDGSWFTSYNYRTV